MLIWIGSQSRTHHDLQMPTRGKKTSMETENFKGCRTEPLKVSPL